MTPLQPTPTPLPPDELARWHRLRLLAGAATPGPWSAGTPGHGSWFNVYCDDVTGSSVADCMAEYVISRTDEQKKANARFIAACDPATITALLDHLLLAEGERGYLAEHLRTKEAELAVSDAALKAACARERALQSERLEKAERERDEARDEARTSDIAVCNLLTDYEAMHIVLRERAIIRHATYQSCSICGAIGDHMETAGAGIKEPPHKANCVLGSGQGENLKARAESAEAKVVELEGRLTPPIMIIIGEP